MCVMSVPPMVILPLVGESRPARMCMSVDLPEPEGPITAVNCPAGTSRLTPRRASTADSPSPKRRVTSQAPTTTPFSDMEVSLCAETAAAQRRLHPLHGLLQPVGQV